jgi:copper chaperone CopZ
MTSPKDPSMFCPVCQTKGTKVKHITLESLLKDEPAKRIGDEQYRFCDSIDCDIVYFGDGGNTFVKDDLTVRVGVKEHDAPRHVCYCFDHTIEEINEEVEKTGESTVLDDIKTRMKEACWCETTSPKGGCCLGTVSKYVKLAKEERGMAINEAEQNEIHEDCCSVDGSCCDSGETRQRTGMFAVGGSVVAASAASACCWIPLGLIVFGMSAGGVSAWFEHYRWLFLGITTVLLGTGFYLVYFRTPKCAPGAACAAPSRKMQRFNRSMLWVATVFVIASASFPKYVGYLLPNEQLSAVSDQGDSPEAEVIQVASFDVKGMTCEACAIPIREEIAQVPGVLDASVSFDDGSASIRFDTTNPPSKADLTAAVSKAGYEADTTKLDD